MSGDVRAYLPAKEGRDGTPGSVPEQTEAPPRLTPKQAAFVLAYMGEAKGNATQAARLAGYEGNDDTLRAIGSENLAKPHIAEAVSTVETGLRKKGLMAIEDIQAAMESIWRGEWRTAEGLPPSEKAQTDALDRLAKMKGAYLERREVDHKGAASVVLYVPDNGRGRAEGAEDFGPPPSSEPRVVLPHNGRDPV